MAVGGLSEGDALTPGDMLNDGEALADVEEGLYELS